MPECRTLCEGPAERMSYKRLVKSQVKLMLKPHRHIMNRFPHIPCTLLLLLQLQHHDTHHPGTRPTTPRKRLTSALRVLHAVRDRSRAHNSHQLML